MIYSILSAFSEIVILKILLASPATTEICRMGEDSHIFFVPALSIAEGSLRWAVAKKQSPYWLFILYILFSYSPVGALNSRDCQ